MLLRLGWALGIFQLLCPFPCHCLCLDPSCLVSMSGESGHSCAPVPLFVPHRSIINPLSPGPVKKASVHWAAAAAATAVDTCPLAKAQHETAPSAASLTRGGWCTSSALLLLQAHQRCTPCMHHPNKQVRSLGAQHRTPKDRVAAALLLTCF